MIKIELPDGSIKEVEAGISGFELANQISHNLAKAALAVEIDGTLKDLTTPLTTNAKVKLSPPKTSTGLKFCATPVRTLCPKPLRSCGRTFR